MTDKHGTFLLTIHLGMEQDLRDQLVDMYRAAFPGRLTPVNSQDEGLTQSVGQSIHMDWYNWYSTHVSLKSISVPC